MSRSLQTLVRDLRLRRGRERRGLALAEGVRLVEEALGAGVGLRGAVVAPGLEATPRGRALKASLDAAGVALEPVSDPELAELADTEHPQGVVAVIEPPRWELNSIAPVPGRPVLVLDAVQDPGNVGTIARTALALGAAGLVALKGTAELSNPKVLRGSMGALFRLPAAATDAAGLRQWAEALGAEIWASAMDGEPIARAVGLRDRRIALVLGNEGAGVSAAVAQLAIRRVAVPLRREAESLNVAVAAGILLYEVMRGV